jgi:hypothetical protein
MGWALGGPDPVSYCLVAFVIVIASLLPSYLLPLTSYLLPLTSVI